MSELPSDSRHHLFGILLGLSGALIISLSGVLARNLEQADSWQIIFYRSVGLFVGLSVLLVVRNPGRVKSVIRAAWPAAAVTGPFQGVSSMCFILALTHTTIANTVFTQASIPVLAACLGWIFLREKIQLSTLLALLGVLAGITLMTIDGMTSGASIGSIYAMLCSVSYAIYLVLIRGSSVRNKSDRLPVVMVAALVSGLGSFFVASSLAVSMWDAFICLFWGVGIQTAGLACILTSARHVPVVELSLITLAEAAAAPIWGWLLVGEYPTLMTVVGGAITLTVVATWLTTLTIQSRRRVKEDVKTPMV